MAMIADDEPDQAPAPTPIRGHVRQQLRVTPNYPRGMCPVHYGAGGCPGTIQCLPARQAWPQRIDQMERYFEVDYPKRKRINGW